MDVVLIAVAGVLAPFVVFAIWRRIPPTSMFRSRLRVGQPTQTWQKTGGDVRRTRRPGRPPGNAPEPSYSRRAPGRTCCGWAGKGVGPGRRPSEFDSTACRFRSPRTVGQSKPTSPSGSNGRPEPQWPDADASNGYIRPSSEEACPRCREFASRGAAYCHACGRRLVGDATSVPIEPAAAAADGKDRPPGREGVGSRSRTSPRLGRSSLP